MAIGCTKPWGGVEILLELAKRLLVAQRNCGLPYPAELVTVIVSVSIILTQAEFEHEHLSALKLLIFLNEWKKENGAFFSSHFLETNSYMHNSLAKPGIFLGNFE